MNIINKLIFSCLCTTLIVAPIQAENSQSPAVKADKHSAQRYQKPGAPIRIISTEVIELKPNSRRSITIEFNTPKRGTLKLSAKAKEGLGIGSADTKVIDLRKELPKIDLDVSAKEEGIYHLMFHAQIEDEGYTSSRVLGVQVRVGNPQPVAQKVHPKIIKMQAEERVN